MLIEFRVKNFKSFRDEQIFSMVASSDKSLPENTIATKLLGGRRLVRSAVLYGANASGKSNLVRALNFAQNFVEESAKRKRGTEISVQPFRLDSDSSKSPSEFEINFIHQEVRYQYSFSVGRQRVYEERLIAYPKNLPQIWFERAPKPDSEESDWYFGPQLKGEKRRLVSVTRPDVLFLSVAATFNHEQLSNVYEWFSDYLVVIDTSRDVDFLEQRTAEWVKKNESLYEPIQALLELADLGIINISIEENTYTEDKLPTDMPDELRSYFLERKYMEVQMRHRTGDSDSLGVLFPIEDESLGTRRLLGISGPWTDALIHGFIVVVDELDASLHPLLVRFLVNLIHNPKINRQNGQLIFNTHDTTLLDPTLFRRDQVWFVEKDNAGVSHLYPLLDFSPRKEESLAKGYLQGRYGAIPFIGELSPELIANAEK
ncbi:MAG: ATP-binding protein [Chloroflexi bacterium]|nr:ATP-binding protein [Chloroflexota bacterium]